MLDLHVEGEIVHVELKQAINAGYAGRNQADVQEHIDELAEEGVPEPAHIPSTYSVTPNMVLVDPGKINVVGPDTSGEAEFGLIFVGDKTFVVAASDHTDRAIETESIQKSKQIAPNVISRQAWLFDDVRDHWDDIQLQAWNTVDGERVLYQDATLEEILPPEDLIDEISNRYGDQLSGTVLLSGTVAAGEIKAGTQFEVQLTDPKLDRSIGVKYDIELL
jgi:hypothetical protein